MLSKKYCYVLLNIGTEHSSLSTSSYTKHTNLCMILKYNKQPLNLHIAKLVFPECTATVPIENLPIKLSLVYYG